MKSTQPRNGLGRAATTARGELGRLGDGLRELLRTLGRPRQPALVPVPALGTRPWVELPPRSDASLLMVFGRRKDGRAQDEDEENEEEGSVNAEVGAEELPPIPSAVEQAAGSSPDEEDEPEAEPAAEGAEDGQATWSAVEPEDDQDEPEDQATADAADLSTWSAGTFEGSTGPEAEPVAGGPWAAGEGDDEADTFTPAVLEETSADASGLDWLQPGAEVVAPWAGGAETSESSSADAGEAAYAATPGLGAEAEVEEISAEAPLDDPSGIEPTGLDSVTEEVAAAEPWVVPASPRTVEPAIFPAPAPVVAVQSAQIALQEGRSFPLPQGDVVFRNLRAGFTDPARLLRHLAGEGHTGVMHVIGVDGSNGYVVLVDGYVVAVANDRQGSLTTTNRISFPNFPNSQDTLNVISYSRQIARGLGLLLHAPVRFAGLGAMFVNLEGLRSYLSKHSSSGGLVVHAQEGVGVALFEDGKLVGAYADNNDASNDLAQLRELVKDLEAEIDVRFGGPKDLDPIPLDTLLAGYPL
ncbi:MAG: hypothetical protein ACREOD_10135 [Candidatus Dormibacteria bacterium]